MILSVTLAVTSPLGQIITFATIGLAGFIVLAFSALFGGHGGDHHHDFQHDGDSDVVSIFSPKILAVFCVGFGAAGLIASILNAGVFVATFSGAGSGIILAAIAFFALSYMHKQQANSLVGTEDIVGRTGRVTTAIPSEGVGEVAVTIQQQYSTHMAKAKGGQAIAIGQTVKILGRTGGVLEVERC